MAEKIYYFLKSGFEIIFIGFDDHSSAEALKRINAMRFKLNNGFSRDSDKIYMDFSNAINHINKSINLEASKLKEVS